MNNSLSSAKFSSPSYKLKRKAGHGSIPAERIEKAQKCIDEPNVDFPYYAREYTTLLKNAIEQKDTRDEKDIHDTVLHAFMMLKGSGHMFGYKLVTEIANNGMHFFENVTTMNDDAITVVKAHCDAITSILDHKIQGDGGKLGYELSHELYQATKRYYKKYNLA